MSYLRYCKLIPVAFFTLFFTVVAFGNLTDFGTNRAFVQHVLAMDSTFQDPDLMWRAIEQPWLQDLTYGFIIVWEILTAILLGMGLWQMGKNINASGQAFQLAKKWAFIGLTSGFALFALGFLLIAGEWFAMWQSESWNAQTTAGMFAGLILLSLIWLGQKE